MLINAHHPIREVMDATNVAEEEIALIALAVNAKNHKINADALNAKVAPFVN
jgi:hypothetical protein